MLHTASNNNDIVLSVNAGYSVIYGILLEYEMAGWCFKLYVKIICTVSVLVSSFHAPVPKVVLWPELDPLVVKKYRVQKYKVFT